jgi:hypothetical protein
MCFTRIQIKKLHFQKKIHKPTLVLSLTHSTCTHDSVVRLFSVTVSILSVVFYDFGMLGFMPEKLDF